MKEWYNKIILMTGGGSEINQCTRKNEEECADMDRDTFCKELLSTYLAGENAR